MRGVKQDRRRNGKWSVSVSDPFPGTASERRFSYDSEKEGIAAKLAIDAKVKAVQAKTLTVPPNVEDTVLWIKSDGVEGLRPDSAEKPVMIQELIRAYLDRQRNRIGIAGDERIGPKHFQANEYHLRLFREFVDSIGCSRVNSAFSADCLEKYKLHASKHFPSKKSISHTLSNVKALIEWAWETSRIDEIPRTIKRFRRVRVPSPEAQTFTRDEYLLLLKSASPRMRLYLLLAVNCAYTQKAISDLDHSQIDLKTGRIDRTRDKIQKKADIPQKSKLWPSTLELLREFATDETPSGPVLLTTQGNPLVKHDLPDGSDTLGVNDSVGRAFSRLRTKCGYEKGRSFKTVRSTGSDLIKNKYPGAKTKTNAELFDMYLAHKPDNMVMSYDPGDWTELYEATDWLGETLGLFDLGSLDGSA